MPVLHRPLAATGAGLGNAAVVSMLGPVSDALAPRSPSDRPEIRKEQATVRTTVSRYGIYVITIFACIPNKVHASTTVAEALRALA